MSSLRDQADDACFQILRYGGEPHSQEIVDLLTAVAALNDDLCNGRADVCVKHSLHLVITAARAACDAQ
jgi:hypothetical protein